jgi:hypothetical protein
LLIDWNAVFRYDSLLTGSRYYPCITSTSIEWFCN